MIYGEPENEVLLLPHHHRRPVHNRTHDDIFLPQGQGNGSLSASTDKFGEGLMTPPALQPFPPVEREIEEEIPLPASTESPLDQTENKVIRRRDERAERGRTTELYRLDLPDEF